MTDTQFGQYIVSQKSVQGRDWPARSPDFNPLDYAIWGHLGNNSKHETENSKINVPMT